MIFIEMVQVKYPNLCITYVRNFNYIGKYMRSIISIHTPYMMYIAL